MSKAILIIGGARSGKSNYAQEMAMKSPAPVLFVATAEAGDDEMRQRIEAHRKARPEGWRTLEVPTGIGEQISRQTGWAKTVVVDCITLLVSNILMKYSDPTGEQIDAALAEKAVAGEISGLIDCINGANATFIIISNEVGLGLVPANKMTRIYRDLLGKANQLLAARADEVLLMVAGIPVRIKPGKTS